MLYVLLPGLGNSILGYSRDEGLLLELALSKLEPADPATHIYPKTVRYGTSLLALYSGNNLVYRILATATEETCEHIGVADHVHLEREPWFSQGICRKRREVGNTAGAGSTRY
jgi:hypothetical protein